MFEHYTQLQKMKNRIKNSPFPGFIAGFCTALVSIAALSYAVSPTSNQNILTETKSTQSPVQSGVGASAPMETNGIDSNGIFISWNSFAESKNNYPGGAKGVSVGKAQLLNVINSMPAGVNTVSIYFGSEPSGVCLMFLPAGTNAGSPNPQILKSTSFCPTNCQ